MAIPSFTKVATSQLGTLFVQLGGVFTLVMFYCTVYCLAEITHMQYFHPSSAGDIMKYPAV